MNVNETQDRWDTHWCQFSDSASLNPAQRMRHRLIVQLLKEFKIKEPIRLLDVGSGQGDLLQELSARFVGSEFLGLELSETGVEISKRKVPGVTFVVADVFIPPTELKIRENWASHGTCSEVLEHVDDPVAFLNRAKHYLSDGAILIVTVPGGKMSAFDRHIGHRRHFTRRSIHEVLEQAGFQIEKIYLSGFPFFNLYRLMVIARGEKLVDDANAEYRGWSKIVAHAAMRVFNLLFYFNRLDSPFGWQIVAVARKRNPSQKGNPSNDHHA